VRTQLAALLWTVLTGLRYEKGVASCACFFDTLGLLPLAVGAVITAEQHGAAHVARRANLVGAPTWTSCSLAV